MLKKVLIFRRNQSEKTIVKKLLLLLALFGVSPFSFSQSQRMTESFVDTILSLGQNKQQVGAQDIYCRTGSRAEKSGPEFPELIDRCMQDICGTPQQNPTTTLTEHNLSQFIPKNIDSRMNSLKRAIQNAVATEVDSNFDHISAARKLMVNNQIRVNPRDMSSGDWQNILHKVYSPFVQMYKDNAAKDGERFEVAIDLKVKQNISEEHGLILRDFVSQLKNHVNNGPWFVKVKYGVLTIDEIKREIRANYQKMHADMEEAIDNDTTFSLSAIFGTREESRLTEVEEMFNNLDNLDTNELHRLSRDLVDAHAEITGDDTNLNVSFCTSGPCAGGVQEYLNLMDMGSIINRIESQNNPNMAINIIDQCRFKVLADNILTPDPSAILEAFPEVLNNFNRNVLTNYSDHSKAAFNRIAQDELEIRAAEHRSSNIQEDLTQNFENIALENEILNDQRTSLSSSDILSWIFKKNTNSTVSYEESINWDVDAFSNINPCRGSRPDLGGDMFRANKVGSGRSPYEIKVSPHTCTHLSSGKGTLAHEMGHFLSRLFLDNRLSQQSYEDYSQKRTCASSAYKFLEPMPPRMSGTHELDHLKTEEDTADLIGIMAMKDQAQNPSPSSCALLVPNRYNTGYEHTSLIDYAGQHSTAPLRVLTESIHQNRPISPSCRELILANRENLRFGACF